MSDSKSRKKKTKAGPKPKKARAKPRAKAKPVLETEAPAPSTEAALLDATGTLLSAEAQQAVYDPAALARVRSSLGGIQAKVAAKMEKILNGQDIRLGDVKLPQEEDPREPPLERLRRYMRLLQETRRRLDEPGFGLCEGCGDPISEEALVDAPWLARCPRCGEG